MKVAVEREAKLEVDHGFTVPDLTGVSDGVSVSERPPARLQAVYYDTPDLRLARRGLTVRHRTEDGGDPRWTVKVPIRNGDGGRDRHEVHVEGGPRRVPDEVQRLLRAHVRGRRLAVVARLTTVRRAYGLNHNGREVLEVADDEVSVRQGRRITERFREVEVEALGAVPNELMDSVVARLVAAGAAPSPSRSKLARALGRAVLEPAEATPSELTPQSLAAEVVQTAIASGTSRLLERDVHLRLRHGPEDVHQARVATRRLRSDLRTFAGLLDEDWVGPVREELRWLGGVLGGVRDPDVLLARLGEAASRLPDEDRAPAAELLDCLREQHVGARAALLEALDSARYVELLDRLVDASASPPLAPRASAPAAEVLPDLLGAPLRRLTGAIARLGKHADDEELHLTRIRAKRLRYAAEAVVPVCGKPALRLGRHASRLQDALGELQDAVTAEQWLRESAAAMSAPKALVAGQLVAAQREAMARARANWQAPARQLTKNKARL